MPKSVIARSLFLLIIMGYLVVAGLFALQTPDWQAPDEPAHYNYVAQVAKNGCCPIIEVGDWQSDYQAQLTANRFAPELLDRLDTIQYEDHQPPLYYLLQSPIYTLTDGSLTALRLVSVLLGGIVVVMTFFIGKELFPDSSQVALGSMAFVAFLPQHVAIMASVNNDALAEVVIALALYMLIRKFNGEDVPFWQLGIIVGIGLMTKATSYFLVGVIPLGMLLHWWRGKKTSDDWTQIVRQLVIFFVPVVLLGSIWFVRNISVYGFPDFLGLAAHDVIVSDQPRAIDEIERVGFSSYVGSGIQTTFNSFWGQFGWMGLPMEPRFYTILTLFTGIAIAGIPIHVLLSRGKQRISDDQATRWDHWIVLILTLLLTFIAFVYYNIEFQQFQGRYLFPALIPFALLMAFGVEGWRKLLLGKWQWSVWLTTLVFFPLIWLDLHMLFRFIVPFLSP